MVESQLDACYSTAQLTHHRTKHNTSLGSHNIASIIWKLAARGTFDLELAAQLYVSELLQVESCYTPSTNKKPTQDQLHNCQPRQLQKTEHLEHRTDQAMDYWRLHNTSWVNILTHIALVNSTIYLFPLYFSSTAQQSTG